MASTDAQRTVANDAITAWVCDKFVGSDAPRAYCPKEIRLLGAHCGRYAEGVVHHKPRVGALRGYPGWRINATPYPKGVAFRQRQHDACHRIARIIYRSSSSDGYEVGSAVTLDIALPDP
jgi:hypothetical protein